MIGPSPSARIEMLPGRPPAAAQTRSDQPQEASGKGFAELLAHFNKAQADLQSVQEKRAGNAGRSDRREGAAGRRASSRKAEEMNKKARLPGRERSGPASAAEDPETGPGAVPAPGPRLRVGNPVENLKRRDRQHDGNESEPSLAAEPWAEERKISPAPPRSSDPGGPVGLKEPQATGDPAQLEPREVEVKPWDEGSAPAGDDGKSPAREMEAASSNGWMKSASLNVRDAGIPEGSPLRISWAQGAGVPEGWGEGSLSFGAGGSLSSLAEWNGEGLGLGALEKFYSDGSNVEDSGLPGPLPAPPEDPNAAGGGSGQEQAWQEIFDSSREFGDASSFSSQDGLAGLLDKEGRSPGAPGTGGAGLLSSSSAPAASGAMEPPAVQLEILEALPRRDSKEGAASSRGGGEAVVLESPAPARPESPEAPAPAKAPAGEVPLDPGLDSFEQQVSQLILSRVRQGESQMRILLRPPNLGQLHVHLTWRGSTLDLSFKVESKSVRELLQSRHQELQRALSAGGVEMEGFHVQMIGDEESRQGGGGLAGEGRTGQGGGSSREESPDRGLKSPAPVPPLAAEGAEGGGESPVRGIDARI